MYLNRLETTAAGHFSISEQQMPVGADRNMLQSRRAELAAGVSRSDPREIVERVARLFLRFPSSRLPEEVAKATLASYAQDLSLFPLWAIDKAFLAVIAGQAGTSKAFVPSSVELRAACERAMQPVHEELADLTKVLNAEVYRDPTPEEKAATHAKFRALVEELKLNVDPRDKLAKAQRPPTRNEAQAALDAIDPAQPMPKFSDALRSKLGIKPAETQEDSQGERAA